jgi:PAS domain S-box-containing protein
MMDRIQEKDRESSEFQVALKRLNETLEQQVLERTRALEESTDQYRILVEHSPDSILIVQGGRVCFANRAFCETFGIEEDEVLDPDFRLGRVFDPSSVALAEGRMAAWERGESPNPTEVLGRDVQGRLRHLELRGSRIEYQSRPAAECLLVDMTEAKRLRERLTETERLRALGELAGGVAHDFNNLLAAVLGRVQLLRKRDLHSAVDHDLGVIEKAAQDGRETVRRIQEFSRTRRDKRFKEVALDAVLRDAMEITKTRWKNEAEQKNIHIDVQWEVDPVPNILGSASELREVVTNLILNAVDAMPRGGTLRIGCKVVDGCVSAWVADNGIGMSDSVRSHVFDPFFTTKGNRGTGLGLSLVYGIVTRHEGRIDIVTELGEGTTFLLAFPVAGEGVVVVGGDGAAQPSLVRLGRILVIDDEPEVAHVVQDILAAEGHTVDVALSGREGVALVESNAYDLVFTDLGMPDMSGWDVAERLSSLRPELPVALVTGWGTTLDEEDARDRGVVAVVQKPFEIVDLVQATAHILAGKRREDGANESGSDGRL